MGLNWKSLRKTGKKSWRICYQPLPLSIKLGPSLIVAQLILLIINDLIQARHNFKWAQMSNPGTTQPE